MDKIYVGKLKMAHRVSNVDVTEKTELRFENGERRSDDPFKLHQEYYVVAKDDLDAFEAQVEQLKRTPVWDENQLLTAKVKALEAENAYLTRINGDFFKERSKLVEENEALVERNTRLKTRVADLKDKIKELGVIKSFLEVGNEKWIRRNTEMEARNRKLEVEKVMLQGKLAQAEHELAKYTGEHTVEFLHEKHEDGKHIIGWTEVSGEEYELTFLTPESKIHA